MLLYGPIRCIMIARKNKQKKLAVLLDPDDMLKRDMSGIIDIANRCNSDYFFVGGSTSFQKPGALISALRDQSNIPVYIFPGNLLQLDNSADGVLLLSLISGRNPELLIGNHVIAAPELKKMEGEVVPVGYILISCGPKTSVEYMSNTDAIPSSKTDIALATAMAGELLGLKMIYLEAGSGAEHPVPSELISAVKNNISIPLIVGGGLKTALDIENAYRSGADIIVLGNGVINRPSLLEEACELRDKLNKKSPN